MLPHREFWGELGGLVKDGVMFSKLKFDEEMARREVAKNGGYVDIEGGAPAAGGAASSSQRQDDVNDDENEN